MEAISRPPAAIHMSANRTQDQTIVARIRTLLTRSRCGSYSALRDVRVPLGRHGLPSFLGADWRRHVACAQAMGDRGPVRDIGRTAASIVANLAVGAGDQDWADVDSRRFDPPLTTNTL
jgi:hypothetical protein